MKICTFCGCKTDNSSKNCASCGGSTFKYVCLNCNEEFEGLYCPACGTRFNAVEKICPNCSTRYFSDACPKCGLKKSDVPHNLYTRTTSYINNSAAGKNGLIAFILAIMGIFFGFGGIIFGIIAIVMSTKADKDNPSDYRFAKTGKIIGIVDIAISVLTILLYIFVGVMSQIR